MLIEAHKDKIHAAPQLTLSQFVNICNVGGASNKAVIDRVAKAFFLHQIEF